MARESPFVPPLKPGRFPKSGSPFFRCNAVIVAERDLQAPWSYHGRLTVRATHREVLPILSI